MSKIPKTILNRIWIFKNLFQGRETFNSEPRAESIFQAPTKSGIPTISLVPVEWNYSLKKIWLLKKSLVINKSIIFMVNKSQIRALLFCTNLWYRLNKTLLSSLSIFLLLKMTMLLFFNWLQNGTGINKTINL